MSHVTMASAWRAERVMPQYRCLCGNQPVLAVLSTKYHAALRQEAACVEVRSALRVAITS
jgi:hypothetical protein